MITPAQSSQLIMDFLGKVQVIPVLVLDDASHAADLAKILVEAGLPILEVTLRTSAALEAMEKMAAVDGAIIAAGTVLTQQQVNECKSAGAEFLVSPGATAQLIDSATHADMPLLPGAATASEMMHLSEYGFRFLKFFPAGINGGVPALKAFSSPLPHLSFCPTGGVNIDNFNDYLALPNVVCVGGSWLASAENVKHRNWQTIRNKVKQLQPKL